AGRDQGRREEGQAGALEPPVQRDQVPARGRPCRRPGPRGGRIRRDLGDRHRRRDRARGSRGGLRGVPSGGRGLRQEARGDRTRVDPLAAVRRAARRQDLGEESAGPGGDVHVHTTGEAMANELILIVEDNEKNLKLVRDVLQYKGYQTIEAGTGEDGVRLARARIADLVVMDMQRTGMDGITALGELRADPETRALPVLALTPAAITADRKEDMAAGLDGH